MGTTACAITGHRELKGDISEKTVFVALENLIKERGINEFYCGMALGFDLLAARCIVKLKNKYPVRLIACIPCPEQDKYFSFFEKAEYKKLLQKADETVLISETYTRYCMHQRNRYMVDHAQYLLCYLREESGGTYYTYKYAKDKNLNIVEV